MFRNYLKSTLRDVAAHKAYSAINIVGLAVGMAAFLLIFVFVRGEFGYDNFVPAPERTYRLDITFIHDGRADEHSAAWMGGYGPLLGENSADVEEVTRYISTRVAVRSEDQLAYELVTFADPNVLDFFGIKAPSGVLEDQSAIVLTETMADKYFERGNAVGQLLTISGKLDYVVAAVIPDLPEKTHLAFQMIAPLHEPEFAWVNREFMSGNTHTYVRMKPGTDTEPLQSVITGLIDSHVAPRANGKFASTARGTTFVPIRDIYLKSKGGVAYKPGGDIKIVYSFMAVALLILIIGSVNYVNLATAKAMNRAQEIGIRKVVGARRGQLIAQFMGESLTIVAAALFLALALVEILSPVLGAYLERNLEVEYFADPVMLPGVILLTLAVGLLAGIYPAIFLSSFKPTDALGKKAAGKGAGSMRQVLVFIQFTIAIAMIAGTIVVVRQTLFANNMDTGFNKEGVLLVRNLRNNDLVPQARLISQELGTVPGVIQAVPSQIVPSDMSEWNSLMHFPATPDDPFSMNILSHGFGYLDLYGIETLAGRKLDETRSSDIVSRAPEAGEIAEVNVLLNERALELLGIGDPEAAIGREIVWPWDEGQGLRFTVVGVMKNIHIRSIRDPIKPMLYFNWPDLYRTISVRFRTSDFAALVEKLEASWAKLAPGVPLDYQILEDRIGGLYQSENRQTRVFVTFAVLAVLIAAIGLLGLAAFSAERRTLEIGIRKTFGAGTTDIMSLMAVQFSKPVLLANLVALPVAWWLTQSWLDGFVYRVNMQPLWFVAAGGGTLIVAWATVAGHAAMVARTNPIHALRYE